MGALAPAALAVQVVGGLVQGSQQEKAAYAAAAVDDENARRTILSGEQQALQTSRDARDVAGQMIAAMGGAGVQLGTGSAFDTLAQSAFEREVEIANVRTRAMGEAANLNQQAADKRKAGRQAKLNSIFGAAATALDGASRMRARNAEMMIKRGLRQPRLDTQTVRPPVVVPRMSVRSGGF